MGGKGRTRPASTTHLCLHLTRVSKVILVSTQNDDNIAVALLPNLLCPLLYTSPGLRITYVVHKEGCFGASVVHGYQASVPLCGFGPWERGEAVSIISFLLHWDHETTEIVEKVGAQKKVWGAFT